MCFGFASDESNDDDRRSQRGMASIHYRVTTQIKKVVIVNRVADPNFKILAIQFDRVK
jgi:hypothetical protein